MHASKNCHQLTFLSLSPYSQINEGCKQTHFTKKNEKIKNSNNEKSISRPFISSDKKHTQQQQQNNNRKSNRNAHKNAF
jgi:hypothetical protein